MMKLQRQQNAGRSPMSQNHNLRRFAGTHLRPNCGEFPDRACVVAGRIKWRDWYRMRKEGSIAREWKELH